ncbi:MAG: tetratricopeptide repeat protein, partial [Gemmatales bacterium]|nr:tetratricopeptide repeat protein [Gemmatales bacterium]MDW8388050.1 tetratricopeptide repeat protein [Gemmatales bacterium]
EAQVNLAFIYQTQGKREEAKEAYRKALALQPELDLARRALAKLEAPPASENAVNLAEFGGGSSQQSASSPPRSLPSPTSDLPQLMLPEQPAPLRLDEKEAKPLPKMPSIQLGRPTTLPIAPSQPAVSSQPNPNAAPVAITFD